MENTNREQFNEGAEDLFHHLKRAKEVGIVVGRIQMMQEMLHDLTVVNNFLHKMREDVR